MKKEHNVIAIPLDRDTQKSDVIKKINLSGFIKVDENDPIGKFAIAIVDSDTPFWKPQQIIVVSDEEIVKDNWFVNEQMDGGQAIWQHNGIHEPNSNPKKIIAAYPQLEGVPTIPLDFLQQWIKRPLDKVFVEYEDLIIRNEPDYFNYDTGEAINMKAGELKLTPNNEIICYMPPEEYTSPIIDELADDQKLEEAAKEFADNNDKIDNSRHWHGLIVIICLNKGFKAGAKWQAEKMYSEEEVKEMFIKAFQVDNLAYEYNPDQDVDLLIQWFEQNKKK
jgi:hypothetical protein